MNDNNWLGFITFVVITMVLYLWFLHGGMPFRP